MDPIEDKPVKIRSTWDGQTLVMTLRRGWTAVVRSLTTKSPSPDGQVRETSKGFWSDQALSPGGGPAMLGKSGGVLYDIDEL